MRVGLLVDGFPGREVVGHPPPRCARLHDVAQSVGRYGYRKISALLKAAGWFVNDKRVERIWRREGLKVPANQPKRGRIWDNDGSCVRLRPEHLPFETGGGIGTVCRHFRTDQLLIRSNVGVRGAGISR